MIKEVIVDGRRIAVESAETVQAVVRRKKVKTLRVNQAFNLKKDDTLVVRCDDCGGEAESLFRHRRRHMQPSTYCDKCGRARTNTERFGVANPFQSADKKRKARQTKKRRYGSEGFTNRAKARKTMAERYGCEDALRNPAIKARFMQSIAKKDYAPIVAKAMGTKLARYGNGKFNNRDKAGKTTKERHGNAAYTRTEEYKRRARETKRRKIIELILGGGRVSGIAPLGDLWADYKNKRSVLAWKCGECGTEFKDGIDNGRIPRCPSCAPSFNGKSRLENDLYQWLKSIGIAGIARHSRTVIPPLEIDIYVPERKLAVEFNGLYWHSELQGKGKGYLLAKTLKCREAGVQLVHVYQDEWLGKREIVQSIIMGKLGLADRRIYARNCEAKEVRGCGAFLDSNHLQGRVGARVKVALFHEGEMVALLAMGKPRYNKAYEWEVVRFCTALRTRVVGGFSKALKFFETAHRPASIVTYADLRYFSGNVYTKAGFVHVGRTAPNYHYTDYSTRRSRIQFQKHKLEAILDKYHSSLTEWQNMQMNGWDRVWDCGNEAFARLVAPGARP